MERSFRDARRDAEARRASSDPGPSTSTTHSNSSSSAASQAPEPEEDTTTETAFDVQNTMIAQQTLVLQNAPDPFVPYRPPPHYTGQLLQTPFQQGPGFPGPYQPQLPQFFGPQGQYAQTQGPYMFASPFASPFVPLTTPPRMLEGRAHDSHDWRARGPRPAPLNFGSPTTPRGPRGGHYGRSPRTAGRPGSSPFTPRRGPLYIEDDIGFDGMLPSSIHDRNAVMYDVKDFRIANERHRVARNMPRVYTDEDLETVEGVENMNLAKWNGAYVEITDDLIARCICPADLLQFPCRFDEFDEACGMLRLCSQLKKYMGYVCPDEGYRSPDMQGEEPARCPHIHWEIEPSCRFVVSGRTCEIIVKKGYSCSCGHDFETGRKISRERFENHARMALIAGAVGSVPSHTIILLLKKHRTMPQGPEPLPEPFDENKQGILEGGQASMSPTSA